MIELIGIVAENGAKLIIDHIVDLGLDAGISGIKKRFNQRKLKKALKEYVTSQVEYNETVTLDQEIDYQGIVDYINDNFIDSVESQIFEVNSERRAQARENIINAAIAYSHAKTDAEKKYVTSFICNCIEIYRRFFLKNISENEYILAADVVDSINEHSNENVDELRSSINFLKNATALLTLRLQSKMEPTNSIFNMQNL